MWLCSLFSLGMLSHHHYLIQIWFLLILLSALTSTSLSILDKIFECAQLVTSAALWGLRFWAPTGAESCRASGFNSWVLSFYSWWISCCWTKSIVRSCTRALRAVTTVENDGGKLQGEWQPDLRRWVHRLSWVYPLVLSFPLGACQ